MLSSQSRLGTPACFGNCTRDPREVLCKTEVNSFIINFQCNCLAWIGTQASTHTVKCKEIKVHFLCKRFFWQELFLFLPLSLILSDPGFLYLLRFCKPLNYHFKVYMLCPVNYSSIMDPWHFLPYLYVDVG